MEPIKRRRRWPGRVFLVLVGWTTGVWMEGRLTRIAQPPINDIDTLVHLLRIDREADYLQARIQIMQRQMGVMGHQVWMARRGK